MMRNALIASPLSQRRPESMHRATQFMHLNITKFRASTARKTWHHCPQQKAGVVTKQKYILQPAVLDSDTTTRVTFPFGSKCN